MALQVEGVVNRGVHAQKILGRSSRLEPLHFALASSHCLMRILRPIVLSEAPLMRTGQAETAERFRGSRYLAEVKDRETLISSPVRGAAAMLEANFVADSLLEGSGFEPSVPLRECRRSEPLARKETSGVGNGVSSTAGPMVRIRFPPAATENQWIRIRIAA